MNTPKEFLEEVHRNLRRRRTRRHKAILERRIQRRAWYLAHLMRYMQEVDDPAPFRGVISYPNPLPVKEPRFCKLPLPVMVQQLLYQRGVAADGEYSRIMAATGLPPTTAEVIQFGRAASCKRREQVERRYLRRLKQRADAAYAAACADVEYRQTTEQLLKLTKGKP